MKKVVKFFYSWKSPWRAWLETIILTSIALAAAFYFNPDNPLFINSPFPWLWFVPIVIALQYRFGPALLAIVAIVLAFCYQYSWHALMNYSYQLFLFGGIMLTLIVSQFSAAWFNRIRQAEATSFYTKARINRLLNDFYMLRYSHDCIEQSVMMKPVTLRGALKDVRKLLIDSQGELAPEIAESFLQLLASHFAFTQAQIYVCQQNEFQSEAIAAIGDKKPFNGSDLLIKQAINDKRTHYFAVNQLDKESHSDFLAALPLRNCDGQLLGMMVIEDIPFLALNRENLTILSILLNYFSDEVWATQASRALLKQHPECPPQFASDLLKMQRLYRDTELDSVLLGFYMEPFDKRSAVIRFISKSQRSLDQVWEVIADQQAEQAISLIMMPFTDSHGVTNYLERKKQELLKEFNIDLTQGPITFDYQCIGEQNLDQLLTKMVAPHG